MSKAIFTHSKLVAIAERWLIARGCVVTSKELAAGNIYEIPDAIGWKSTGSILVECKATRTDFLADSKKFVRNNEQYAVGRERWFLAPKNLIQVTELPSGWGLIECCESKHECGYFLRVKQTAKARRLGAQGYRSEYALLISIARRACTAFLQVRKLGIVPIPIDEYTEGDVDDGYEQEVGQEE